MSQASGNDQQPAADPPGGPLRPLLSVVTATRSGSVRLPALIESLVAQDIELPWEWVVVLDGVTDQTPSVLDRAAEVLPLRVLRFEEGQGVSAALRAGYAEARGTYVLRCDDDLTLPPSLLSGHLRHHLGRRPGDPPVGVVSMTRDVFESTPYAAAYGRRANDRLLEEAYRRPADELWQHWAACNSVARESYEAVGGFDASLSYREDSDLGYRLARSGVGIVIDPALEVEHRGPVTSAADRAARAYLSGATLQAFEARHPRAGAGRAATPGSAWQRLTTGLSRMLRTDRAARAAGAAVDLLLPVSPAAAGGRLVAATVEAAGMAGSRSDTTTWDRRPRSLGPHPVDHLAARVMPTVPLLDKVATSVVGVETSRPEVVLTFDDGPTPGTTDRVLEVLRDHGASATFFVLANRAARHPSVLAEVVDAGHEIAVHGPDHRRLTLFSAREVHDRTRDARYAIEDLAGVRTRWFRPPYGAQGIRAWAGVRRTGLEPVLWGPTFNDWREVAHEERLRLAVDGTSRGSILLAHDGFAGPCDGVDDGPEPTIDRGALLDQFLSHLADQGMQGVSLSHALRGGDAARATWLRSVRSTAT